MKIFDFYNKEQTPFVLALGFFDSLHIGHCEIIANCKLLAKKLNASDVVFTFENDVASVFKKSSGLVYTFEERLQKFKKLQVDSLISTRFTKEFSQIEPLDFLKILINNFNVLGIVCGSDYTFGKDGEGTISTLVEFCKLNKIELQIINQVKMGEEKVSTSLIKEKLSLGKIEDANKLLGMPYFISGEVKKDRQVGRSLGFPTANVNLNSQKLPIKLGVYKTFVEIDGKIYKCITNFGARPTFDLADVLTETYIDGFCGDLYGKTLTIYFESFLRDLIKFNSADDLKLQLEKDLGTIK